MTTTRRVARVASGCVLALLVPLALAAQKDSLADIRTAGSMIDETMRRHLFDPRILASPASERLSALVDSLARTATSQREFMSGFNRLWRAGPVSHVRMQRALMPAGIMMHVVDTMRVGEGATSLRWDGTIAILTVNTMMGLDTRERISVLYREIVEKQASGLIIDLRENGGGAFAVVPLVGHLIERPFDGGVFLGRRWFATHDRVPTPEEIGALTPWTGWSVKRFWNDVETAGILRIQFAPMAPRYAGPVIVLTSEKTASAAEMATDALLHGGRTSTLGERTAGQMLSQRMFDLVPGIHLLVPIADYHSARMGRIEGVGIPPSVAMPAAVALDSAIARLRAGRQRRVIPIP
jgi:carboxyl-terminal processing protease